MGVIKSPIVMPVSLNMFLVSLHIQRGNVGKIHVKLVFNFQLMVTVTIRSMVMEQKIMNGGLTICYLPESLSP